MRACPVCLSKHSESIHEVHFVLPDKFPLNAHQSILNCKLCGMVFSDSGNNQKDFDAYYGRSSKYTGVTAPTKLEVKRFSQTGISVSRYINRDSEICDLGCGSGGLLRHLASLGFRNLTGIDGGNLDEAGFKFIRSDLFSSDLKETMDMMICTGVLEHVFDLDRLLQNIRDVLKAEKYLYIEVPDASLYAKKITSPFQDFNLEHINHFSIVTLENLLRRNGFKIIESESFLQQETERHQMPVIRMIAAKHFQKSEIIPDHSLRDHMMSYIQKSEFMINAFEKFLIKELTGADEVYIWGTGQLTLKLLNLDLFKTTKVAGLIDKNSVFETIKGTPVQKPSHKLNPSIPIIIGSTLHSASILEDIKKLGLKNSVIELPV